MNRNNGAHPTARETPGNIDARTARPGWALNKDPAGFCGAIAGARRAPHLVAWPLAQGGASRAANELERRPLLQLTPQPNPQPAATANRCPLPPPTHVTADSHYLVRAALTLTTVPATYWSARYHPTTMTSTTTTDNDDDRRHQSSGSSGCRACPSHRSSPAGLQASAPSHRPEILLMRNHTRENNQRQAETKIRSCW